MANTKNIPVTKSPTRRGGRPSRADAARLRDKILDAAAAVFFDEGYGATSIESIAKRARISKRTLYSRFRDKADLFGAVVRHVIDKLRTDSHDKSLTGNGSEKLQRLASNILHGALKPQSISLFRLVLAEATRFPELAEALHDVGAREMLIRNIAALLEKEFKTENAAFAAEQFLQMVVSAPQRRALGLGTPFTEDEINEWAANTVRLFVGGCRTA